MSNQIKILLLIVIALLPVTIISPRCYADRSTDFIPADENAQSQGILGYLTFVDPEDNTRTVLVVATSLFSAIEQTSNPECDLVYSAISNVTGEQLTISINKAGAASFTQDDVVVGTLVADLHGGYTYTGSTELQQSLVYRALLAAAMDTNLTMIQPCQGQVAFDIPLNRTFQRDNRAWFVASATIRKTATDQTFVTFSAHSNQDIEDWNINISTEMSIAQTAMVNGQLAFSFQLADNTLTFATSTGMAMGDMSQGTPSASMLTLLQEARPSIDFVSEIFHAVSDASRPAAVDVEEQCRLGCNDGFPYGSNCLTVTEKWNCCYTDATRAACRRACACEVYGGWYGVWCMSQVGVLAEIDLLGCAPAPLYKYLAEL